MIPKVIHYCWFGRGEKPKLAEKCIASWKKFCPDYEIIQWNEDNFDVNLNAYTRYCYENKKWAFLSDYARLKILYDHGGIYFDTDVEVVRAPDGLLGWDAFYGFETSEHINTGLGFGAVPHHPSVQAMMEMYHGLEPDSEGNYPLISCPQLNTKALLPLHLHLNGERQEIDYRTLILPPVYMNPYDDPTGILNQTAETLSIHWYSKSWMTKGTILRSKLTRPFHRLFGRDCFQWIKK